MNKQEVVGYFGTQEETANFINSKLRRRRQKPIARSTVAMWGKDIPVKWALFLDKHTDLVFNKEDYQK